MEQLSDEVRAAFVRYLKGSPARLLALAPAPVFECSGYRQELRFIEPVPFSQLASWRDHCQSKLDHEGYGDVERDVIARCNRISPDEPIYRLEYSGTDLKTGRFVEWVSLFYVAPRSGIVLNRPVGTY